MTAVARVLPRDWDGHRLLRFLAGLALVALAFTAPLTPSSASREIPAPAPAVVASSEVTRPATAAAPLPDPPVLPVTPAAPRLILAAASVPTAFALRPHAVRGPPLS